MYFKPESRDILVIGSSTTVGLQGPSSIDKAYVTLLQNARPNDNFYVAAEGGTDVDDWVTDIGFGTLPQFQDIIILQLGINLWLTGTPSSTFSANLGALIGQIRTYHDGIPIYFLHGWRPRTNFASQLTLWEEYRAVLHGYADTQVLPFIYFDRYESNPELFLAPEGIHYNDTGHEILAKTLLDVI